MKTPVRALLYGDVDMNLIDGSSIWVQSTAEVLARAGCEVTLVLKAAVRTTRLLDPLGRLPGVHVVRPFEDGVANLPRGTSLPAAAAVGVMRELDARAPFDLVVLRGRKIVNATVASGAFDRRLWTYLTDIPQSVLDLDPETIAELERIATASRFMLCQTEELRAFLESTVGPAGGRSLLFPPVVPGSDEPPQIRPIAPDRPIRLVYSGKFAPRWKTLEMTALPAALAGRAIPAELHMVGDKIHGDPGDAGYAGRMEAALRETAAVTWRGGLPRDEAIDVTRAADIALGWRDRDLDTSLELSTKLLEYGGVGLPVVLNRTPMHETLLGRDYPLFAATAAEVVDTIEHAVREPAVLEEAARRCVRAADTFTLDRAVDRVRGYLERAFAAPAAFTALPRPLRVGVASHDLKFFSRIQDHLESLPNVELRVDAWPSLSVNDERGSRELLGWADVVICEWAGPNAVWYSERKRSGQRLIVRLHRRELYRQWIPEIRAQAIDQVICVSPHYARLTIEGTGWDPGRVVVVPNWVDDLQLDRPKLEGAMFRLGLLGMAPARKRFDLAVEVLDRLRVRDRRFRLFVKSRLPWEFNWVWREPPERVHFASVFGRIQGSERLRDGVVFDRFGADVTTWLRGVGFVLSTSDDESFHLAPAEGAASGAVPMLLNWPGSEAIYDRRWIHDSPAAIADHIHEIVADGRWDEERELARAQVKGAYRLQKVLGDWERILLEDLEPWSAATMMTERQPNPV